MDLQNIGEFLLVRRVLKRIKMPSPRAVVGPGDDALVVKMSPSKLLVVTKDLLVEHVHFDLCFTDFFSLGYKSMVVNLSDLAAMGGARPLFAVVGLALPVDITTKFVDNLYSGMLEAGAKYGFFIGGGDTVSSKKDIVISITLFGEIKKDSFVTRNGAEVGDLVAVSGYFGDSAAGLRILQSRKNIRSQIEKYLVKKHLCPQPLLEYASKLSRHKLATSMIDSSDGLAASLKFIAESSDVGMDIFMEKIPVSDELRKWSASFSRNYFWSMVLGGGEEYELVFTTRPENFSRLKKLGLNAYPVGKIVRRRGIHYFLNGSEYRYTGGGFEHFR